MELNWSTFILEIINFLVLVWILKRFLYRPVLEAIEARKNRIAQEKQQIDALKEETERLNRETQNKKNLWEEEKEQRHHALIEEIAAERESLMEQLHTELEQERRRQENLDRARRAEINRKMEAQALRQGGRFVSRLLERLACPELEARQIELLMEELHRLPPEKARTIQTAMEEDGGDIKVFSGFTIPGETREQLSEILQQVAGPARVSFHKDESLLSGVSVHVGYWVLEANLKDEMKFFMDIVDDEH
ncbi:MAG: hypothetical protein OEZ59_01655 [Deltaproteobacteria bacterium]|nr:hypothetical protein [Deltaproteobacteria bacterium]